MIWQTLLAFSLITQVFGAGPPDVPVGQLNADACVEDEDRGSVECIYTVLNSVFEFPETYSNMTLNMYGPSGGRSLGTNNLPDDRTRGLGLHLSGTFADNLKNVTFVLYMGPNGEDAGIDKPGIMAPIPFPIHGGSGGWCNGSEHSRYGASGSSAVGMARSLNSVWKTQMTLWIGGAGGAGAFDPDSDDIPLGAHSPAINLRNDGSGSTPGNTGLPKSLSGTGGTINVAGMGGKGSPGNGGQSGSPHYYDGGNGGSSNRAGIKYCLSGGGGGVGARSGGGGSATVQTFGYPKTAGSGGSGNSAIMQEPGFLTNIKQRNTYTNMPRIVFSYSKRPPILSCIDGLCVIMRK